MTTLNHALWGLTFGRVIGMPLQGAIVGSMPDILSIPLLAYYHFQEKKKVRKIPPWLFKWYSLLHNWVLAGLLILILFLINEKLWILGLAYGWHVIEDAFVHTEHATTFLYPLWKGKIQRYSASDHKWIQVVDFFFIVVINILLSIQSRF